jgi:replicative DNA helicase
MFLNRDRQQDKNMEEQKKEEKQDVQLIVAKNRNGPEETFMLTYVPHLTKFYEQTKDKG